MKFTENLHLPHTDASVTNHFNYDDSFRIFIFFIFLLLLTCKCSWKRMGNGCDIFTPLVHANLSNFFHFSSVLVALECELCVCFFSDLNWQIMFGFGVGNFSAKCYPINAVYFVASAFIFTKTNYYFHRFLIVSFTTNAQFTVFFLFSVVFFDFGVASFKQLFLPLTN